ncbi:MAG: insulinase family protein, partial [Bacteroidota bacterium]
MGVGDVQVIACSYHIPPGSHPEYAAAAVLDEILTNEPAGRLYKSLVETQKASSVSSFTPALKEGSFMYFSADVRMENSLEDAKTTLLKSLDEIAANPPTAEEVDRAKKRLLKQWELRFRNSTSVGLAVSGYLAMGDWRLGFLFRDNVESVKPADVLAIAKNYLKPSNRTVGTFIPDKSPDRAEIPDAPNLASLLANYKGKELIAEGEAFDASPQNIESRTVRGEAKDKGIEYAFLPKETRGDAVSLRLTLRFGDENSLKGKATAAEFAAQMLDKGTPTLTRQQIQDKLDQLKTNLSVFGSGSIVSVNIESDREHIAEAVKLVGELVKNPAFSEAEFAKLKEEELAGIESQRSEPQALAFQAYSKMSNAYPKDDVRYPMDFDEQTEAVNKLTVQEVKDFYKKFYGATDATVSVVGDFDQAVVKQAV